MGWTILNQGQGTNIHGLTLETNVSPTVDEIIFYDDSAGGNRRTTLDALNLPASALASTLDLSDKTLTLPPAIISGQQAITSTDDTDYFLIWDASANSGAGGLAKVSRASLLSAFSPSGAVVQTVAATPYTANVDITSVVALATTPTTSNGTEIISASITPASSSNKILVNFSGCACATAGFTMAALFCGSTLLNVTQGVQQVTGYPWNYNFSHLHAPASTSAQTYSVRVALASAGSMRFNGGYNGAHYGTGTSSTNLILQEIKA